MRSRVEVNTSFEDLPMFLNVDETAMLLGKSSRTVRRWLASFYFPGAMNIDGRWSIPKDSLRKFIEAHTVKEVQR